MASAYTSISDPASYPSASISNPSSYPFVDRDHVEPKPIRPTNGREYPVVSEHSSEAEKGRACSYCNRILSTRAKRDRHVKDKHTKPQKWVSPCGSTLSRADNLKQHIKRCRKPGCAAERARLEDEHNEQTKERRNRRAGYSVPYTSDDEPDRKESQRTELTSGQLKASDYLLLRPAQFLPPLQPSPGPAKMDLQSVNPSNQFPQLQKAATQDPSISSNLVKSVASSFMSTAHGPITSHLPHPTLPELQSSSSSSVGIQIQSLSNKHFNIPIPPWLKLTNTEASSVKPPTEASTPLSNAKRSKSIIIDGAKAIDHENASSENNGSSDELSPESEEEDPLTRSRWMSLSTLTPSALPRTKVGSPVMRRFALVDPTDTYPTALSSSQPHRNSSISAAPLLRIAPDIAQSPPLSTTPTSTNSVVSPIATESTRFQAPRERRISPEFFKSLWLKIFLVIEKDIEIERRSPSYLRVTSSLPPLFPGSDPTAYFGVCPRCLRTIFTVNPHYALTDHKGCYLESPLPVCRIFSYIVHQIESKCLLPVYDPIRDVLSEVKDIINDPWAGEHDIDLGSPNQLVRQVSEESVADVVKSWNKFYNDMEKRSYE